MKKDKLYTVNKWNRPAFMPKENLYSFGSWLNNQTDAMSKWGGADKLNSTSKGLLGAAGNFGGAIGGAISSGYDDGGVGNGISSVGGGIGSAISTVNPLIGGIVSVGSGLIGGLFNRMFGVRENKQNTNFIKQNTENLSRIGNAFAGASTNEDLQNIAGNMRSSSGFKWDDLYSNGWFTSKGTRLGNNLINKEKNALAIQTHGLTTGARNVDYNLDSNIMRNFGAFGGPLDMLGTNNMGAIGYGFMSDYLNMKNNQAQNKNNMTNPFAGVSPQLFANGGGIHIKPENRGKFTALKERTGHSATWFKEHGTPAQKKMATFALNARHWNHADGGPLFAFGGELGTNGTDWTNGLLYVDEGGSHEENPLEGVPMGFDENGVPNLVEEGETIFNNYVFSDRIKVPNMLYKELGLGNATKRGMTFAEASKKLGKESEQRPNDPISQDGLEASLAKLAQVQEAERMKQRIKEDAGLLGYAYGGKKANKFSGEEDHTNEIDKNKDKDKDKIPMLPTLSRYAPAWGNGILTLGDLVGLTNQADYTYPNKLENAAARAGIAPTVAFKPSGDYLEYNPMDIWQAQNRLDANARATDRAIINNASPASMAGLLASGYNNQIAGSDLYRKALEYNDAKRQQVADFNRKTNMFNSQMGLEAAMANARYDQQAKNMEMSGLAQVAALREGIDQRIGAARTANLSNFLTSLGNIGRENFAMNQIRSSQAANNGYWIDSNGMVHHLDKEKKSCGGKIKRK